MVLKKLNLLLETQFTELNAETESENHLVAQRHMLPFMRILIKKLLKFGLDQMLNQYQMISKTNTLDHCTGLFRKSFAIPCQHEINTKIQNGEQLHVDDFHSQWYLDQNPLFFEYIVGSSSNRLHYHQDEEN